MADLKFRQEGKVLVRYVPPHSGRVVISVTRSFSESAVSVPPLSFLQCADLIKGANSTTNIERAISYAIEGRELNVGEAIILHKCLTKEIGSVPRALAKLLPLCNVTSARKLFNIVTRNNRSTILQTKLLLGKAFWPLLGYYDGFYTLDMSQKNDRLTMSILIKQACKYNALRKEKKLWDISQHGTFSCLRNEYFLGKEVNSRS